MGHDVKHEVFEAFLIVFRICMSACLNDEASTRMRRTVGDKEMDNWGSHKHVQAPKYQRYVRTRVFP